MLIERRVKHPLLPLHIVWDRARGGSYTALLVTGAGIFAVFLFLTYFLQQNLGFSPLKTGLAFLPLSAVLIITSTTVQTRVIQRTGVKPLVLLGMALGVVGMLLFTQLTPTSSYGTGVLPGLLVIGVGMGCIFAPAFSAGTLGVAPNEAGIASAMVNTSQQVGGSIGTSLLSTIYATAVASYLTTHAHVPGLAPAAQVHGDTTAFWWAAGIFGLGFLLALVILPGRCEARPATIRAALARQVIGNCHYDETGTARPSQTARAAPEPALGAVGRRQPGPIDSVHAGQDPGAVRPGQRIRMPQAWPSSSEPVTRSHDDQATASRRPDHGLRGEPAIAKAHPVSDGVDMLLHCRQEGSLDPTVHRPGSGTPARDRSTRRAVASKMDHDARPAFDITQECLSPCRELPFARIAGSRRRRPSTTRPPQRHQPEVSAQRPWTRPASHMGCSLIFAVTGGI